MTLAASVAALSLFIPITKVDVAKRLVYGIATAEVEDRSGEICDYASTKPLYEKWSGDIAKSTDGKSLGNLRAMHGKIAAGKVTEMNLNDEAKQVEICAKVVDDNEWNKVVEGVYTGFSQGGSYVKRWKDELGKQRYTAAPGEISLVDLPCLASATFSVIKADGATEMRKFVTVPVAIEPTNDEIVAKATELAKAAGQAGFADFITQARAELTKAVAAPEKAAELPAVEALSVPAVVEKTAPVAAAAIPNGEEPWEQVWLCKADGKTFKTKAELRKHLDALSATTALAPAVVPIQKSLDSLQAALGIEKVAALSSAGDVSGTPAQPGVTDLTGAGAATKGAQDAVAAGQVEGSSDADKAAAAKGKKKPKKYTTAEGLQKGLYAVGRLASLLADLNYLQQDAMWEANSEADGSTVPDQLKSNVAAVCATLRAMVAEETSELFDPESENDSLLLVVLENAAGMPKNHMDALVKIATDDAGFEKCRDAVLKAGKRHSKQDQTRIQDAHDNLVAAGADCGGDADKAAKTGDLAKTADELGKVTASRDALQKVVDELQPQLDTITKAVQHLLDQPRPHPVTRVVSKGQDNGGDADVSPEATLAKMTPDQLATMAIKLSQRQGMPLLDRGK